MNEPTYVLKNPKSKEPTLIYLLFRYTNQKLKYSTGEKIKPKYWNATKQRAKLIIQFKQGSKINGTLDDLANTVKDSYRALLNGKKIPTTEKLRNELDKYFHKEELNNTTGLLKFIGELIENSNKKERTIKQYQNTLNILVKYKNYIKRDIDFDSINMDFYYSFLKFLQKENYAQNTIGGIIKNLKVFMSEAVDRKLTTNFEFRNRKFKKLEEVVNKIYLNEAEIQKIYELDLSQNPKLDNVRDLFMIACYTGLRFSDLKTLTSENINYSSNFIKIKTEKTGEYVIIPMHKYVRAIYLKYDCNLPTIISNQKMNDYLKEVGEKAKLEEKVKIGITKGGKIGHETFKKFQLISSHTARRSFATNAYLKNVPPISIMKITGHQTEKVFMKYIRISQEENAAKLLEHPFFNS